VRGGNEIFLHIGNAQIVFKNDLIGIFNYDLLDNIVNVNLFNDPLTHKAEIKPRPENPKSFIVTGNRIYTSPISPLTLSRRCNVSR